LAGRVGVKLHECPRRSAIRYDRSAPIYDANDSNEAIYASFAWDIRRGAVGSLPLKD